MGPVRTWSIRGLGPIPPSEWVSECYAERVGPFLPRRSLPVKWFAYLSASWFWPPEFKLGHWLWLCDLRIPYYTSISSTVPLYTHPLNCKFYIESVLLLMSLHLLSRIIFITLSVSLSPRAVIQSPSHLPQLPLQSMTISSISEPVWLELLQNNATSTPG